MQWAWSLTHFLLYMQSVASVEAVMSLLPWTLMGPGSSLRQVRSPQHLSPVVAHCDALKPPDNIPLQSRSLWEPSGSSDLDTSSSRDL